MPRTAEMAGRAAVLPFTLNPEPNNRVGRRFDELPMKHLPGVWRMTCPRLPDDTGMGGHGALFAPKAPVIRLRSKTPPTSSWFGP